MISDTHGLMRPQALLALKGVDLIIHAGDVGKPEIIQVLETIAPVIVIKGNNDHGSWARPYAKIKTIKLHETKLFVIHDLKDLRFDPRAKGYHAVISGHSHKPAALTRGGVLFVNPGSAGPRRFRLPVTVGKLTISDVALKAEIIELKI